MTSKHLSNKKSAHKKPKKPRKARPKGSMAGLRANRKSKKVQNGRS